MDFGFYSKCDKEILENCEQWSDIFGISFKQTLWGFVLRID